eukprot:8651372-Lingulodinium_polyedra.AAC.1
MPPPRSPHGNPLPSALATPTWPATPSCCNAPTCHAWTSWRRPRVASCASMLSTAGTGPPANGRRDCRKAQLRSRARTPRAKRSAPTRASSTRS